MEPVRLFATLIFFSLFEASKRGRGKENKTQETALIMTQKLLPKPKRGPGRPRKNNAVPNADQIGGTSRHRDKWLDSMDGYLVHEDDMTEEDQRLFSLFPPTDYNPHVHNQEDIDMPKEFYSDS
jgi:hypothetical protein